jgi:bifunctional UDP-N-acetylglucosamine pyrophosphorylase/glucosamine-1-phosphate N-acetyltransferase
MSLIRTVCLSYAAKGVTFTTLDGVVICPDAVIGGGTVIGGGVQIKPGCVIGENCVIEAGSVLSGCRIGDGCRINASQITDSTLEEGVTLGPYSQIRPGCVIGSGCKIGDFVEIKNATLGKGTKVAHLTYIGDAEVGSGVNFGCGTVISNYDGKHKYRTVIGNDAFIGCNTNLIAPVTVEDGAYTAAGSTITENVPAGALGIARSRQSNIEGWVQRRFGKDES